MDKRFAIFDMDGTLIDSMGYWHALAEEYLRAKGVEDIPADLPQRIETMTMTESAALFRREFGLSATAETLAAEMNAMMEEHYRRDIPLKGDILRELGRLQGRGIRMCVASATAGHLIEACLSRLGVRSFFDFLLSCEEVGAGKDRPDIYLTAAARLGAEPGDIAVYEDALYAARTAKAAGFYVVGVPETEDLGGIADEIYKEEYSQ